DQRLDAVAEADLGENSGSVSAGLWSRLPDANRRPRQSGGRPTGGDETDGIVLPCQAQTVRGYPGVLHQCLQISDVSVGADPGSRQTLYPVNHSVSAKTHLQGLLQGLPVERRDAGQTVHHGQTRCVILACTDEEPPVTRPVGAMQGPRAQPVRST